MGSRKKKIVIRKVFYRKVFIYFCVVLCLCWIVIFVVFVVYMKKFLIKVEVFGWVGFCVVVLKWLCLLLLFFEKG